MSGYLITGLVCLFAPLAWGSYRIRRFLKIPKEKRVKKGLHDRQIKEVIWIIRLRDAAFILTLCGVSAFCFINVGISRLTVGSPAYINHNTMSEFVVMLIFAMLTLGIALSVLTYYKHNKLLQATKLDSQPRVHDSLSADASDT